MSYESCKQDLDNAVNDTVERCNTHYQAQVKQQPVIIAPPPPRRASFTNCNAYEWSGSMVSANCVSF